MSQYYLAVDIGASSGRHILGSIQDGKMLVEEIYRFDNGMINTAGHKCWPIERLFDEIKKGLCKCKELGKIPVSMGIDTWGVDYVLLDKRDRILGHPYGYRDTRTSHMEQEVYKRITEEQLYARTGIQKQSFNTIYQLMAAKQLEKIYLDEAETFLMLPDYFNFRLTDVKCSEYTNATTTQLVSPHTKQWDYEMMDLLGYPKHIFLPLSYPGTCAGHLSIQMEREIGFNCRVILPATHDTASAVMAVPSIDDDFLYISSGTWSLMGVESERAFCSQESEKANFTNEGGYLNKFRFLKNIMGLWMIQSVRHELHDKYTFEALCELAEAEKEFPSRVDVQNTCFLAPESMIAEIKKYCHNTGQRMPETIGQIASVIYHSLAECYAKTADEIESITGKSYKSIYIVGGGSNAAYLNRLTAEKSNRTVYAGPAEATAIGNLTAQMLEQHVFHSLHEARKCIRESFDISIYHA